MKGYRQFLKELPSKKVVFAFGRFNPPTTGHELLVKAVKKLAADSDHVIYASRSQDSKKNPLPVDRKVYYLQRMFPGTKFVAANESVRTFIEAAKELNKKYKDLVMVAGSDRVPEYKKLLDKYNGKEFKFNSIQVISAGERDPDSDEASGMSATKMREAAKKGEFLTFKRGLPHTLTTVDARRLMNEVREGMGLEPIKESIKFTVDQIREKYFHGEIYHVGQIVESDGQQYEIVKRGSNHLLLKEQSGKLVSKFPQNVTLVEDIKGGDIPDEITFHGYTTKNLHHSEDARRAFIDTIERVGSQNPAVVLNALRATDTYMKLNDMHLEQGKAPDESEIKTWIAAHDHAKQYLESLGEFMHHEDYWHMHLHELEGMLSDYKEKGKDEMSEEKEFPKVRKDKESGLPKKYVSGLSKSTAKARAAHWKEKEKYSDSDPRAYEPAPGDATAETKPSKYTKKYKELYGEETEELQEMEKQLVFTAADKIKVARIIATTLGVDNAQSSANAVQLVNQGLRNVRRKPLTKNGYEILMNMLKTARLAGIDYDEKLIPTQAQAVEEAVSPAQQAAIAIAMKKAGKTPKNEEQIDEISSDLVKKARDAAFSKGKDDQAFRFVKKAYEKGKKESDAIGKKLAEETLEENTAVKNKAEKSGVPYSILKQVYNRGVAAWNSGHRPGTTPEQWGLARVNSYITKGKTYHTADKDLREIVQPDGTTKVGQYQEGRGPMSDLPNTDRTDKKGVAYNPFRKERTADDLKRIAAAKSREKKDTGLYRKQSPAQRAHTVKSLMNMLKDIGEETEMQEESDYNVKVTHKTAAGEVAHKIYKVVKAKDHRHAQNIALNKHISALDKAGTKFVGATSSVMREEFDLTEAKVETVVVDTSSNYNIAQSIMRYSDLMKMLGKNPIEKAAGAYQDENFENFPEMPQKKDTESDMDAEVGNKAEPQTQSGNLMTPPLEADDNVRRRKIAYHLGEGKEIEFLAKPDVENDEDELGDEEDKGYDAFFEEGDLTDDEIQKMVDSMSDDEIVDDAYEDDEFAIVDDESGEEIEEEIQLETEEALMEVLSRMERIRAKQRLMRTKAKRERAAKIALRKFSTTKVVNKRARRLAIKAMKKRFTRGRDLKKISVAEKERLEARIKKLTPIINRIALKMVPRVRQLEKARLSHKNFTK